jgi:hypothetical protein
VARKRSRHRRLNAFKIPDALPNRYRVVERLHFAPCRVNIEINHRIAKIRAGHPASVQQVGRVAQGLGQGRQAGIDVGVAFIQFAAIKVFPDAALARVRTCKRYRFVLG